MSLNKSSLSYEVLQKCLVFMLETDWRTEHSLQDHHNTTSNTCLVCQVRKGGREAGREGKREGEREREGERNKK